MNKGIYIVTNAEFEQVLIPAELNHKLSWSRIRVCNKGVVIHLIHSDIQFHYLEKR